MLSVLVWRRNFGVKLLQLQCSCLISVHLQPSTWIHQISDGDYTKLKPFGCKAFSHVRRGKLESRAIKCAMLGYQKGVNGYRLWSMEPRNNKVIISRDVTFKENEMPYIERKLLLQTDRSDGTLVEVELFDKDGEDSDEHSESNEEPQPTSNEDGSPELNDLADYQMARDRQRRVITPPARYINSSLVYYALCVAEGIECSEPMSYKEALKSSERARWIKAMKEEMDSLIRNKTWILVTSSKLQTLIGYKWIFKRMIEAALGNKVRYKARLVAKGYTERRD